MPFFYKLFGLATAIFVLLAEKLLVMKFLRVFLKILLGLIVVILVILAFSVAPVDDTPYQQMPYYRQTKQRLAQLPTPPAATAPLRAGWAKSNITPAYPTATGGYGARHGKLWHVVSDSIFARAIVLNNGSNTVAVVALDLLITPPMVTEALKKRLPEVGLRWENMYMGAIHSHNSVGGWSTGFASELIAGDYDEKIVNQITDGVLTAIRNAQTNMAPVQVGFGQTDATDHIYNRIGTSTPQQLDGLIRLLQFKKATGESALICTFSGHATLFEDSMWNYLSRDYPGSLVDRLEKKSADFAMFMAGAVGSTGPEAHGQTDFAEIRNYAGDLATRIERTVPQIQTKPDSVLTLLTLPLSLREPHPRIADNWRVRPWLFYAVFGDYPSDLKALRIGQTVLLGTPCDFSGELVADFKPLAQKKGVNLMITSFDGGYVGYITPDQYYHQRTYETRDMNWFGPYNGAYFEEMMMGLLRKI